MSKELSNREQKFRDEYMDILYQAIRKEHPPGKYLLLDKDDLRKLTELFKRVYQEGEYIDMNDIKEFLTKEDKEFFFNNIGFFNFWDEYLILHTPKMKDYYWCVVNRTDKKFSGSKLNNEVEVEATQVMNKSFEERKPEEMYEDFPELKDIECINYE